jgi:hypothetical protein
VIISVGYLLARGLLDGLMVLTRRELSKDADGILGTHRLKRMQYRPGLLASTGLDLTPFCNPDD